MSSSQSNRYPDNQAKHKQCSAKWYSLSSYVASLPQKQFHSNTAPIGTTARQSALQFCATWQVLSQIVTLIIKLNTTNAAQCGTHFQANRLIFHKKNSIQTQHQSALQFSPIGISIFANRHFNFCYSAFQFTSKPGGYAAQSGTSILFQTVILLCANQITKQYQATL